MFPILRYLVLTMYQKYVNLSQLQRAIPFAPRFSIFLLVIHLCSANLCCAVVKYLNCIAFLKVILNHCKKMALPVLFLGKNDK